MKRPFLILLLATLASTGRAGPTPESLDALDRDPALAALTGQDRLTKWLVNNADQSPSAQINAACLDAIIAQLLTQPETMTLIGADLNRGDDHLRGACTKLLYTYNFSAPQATAILANWAAHGPDENLQRVFAAAAKSPGALRLFRDYALATPEYWPRIVNGLDATLANQTPFTGKMLHDTIMHATQKSSEYVDAELEKARRGNLQSRWNIANMLVPTLAVNGGVVRYLKAYAYPKQAFYYTIWHQLIIAMSREPGLFNELVARTLTATPLYTQLRGDFNAALQTGGITFASVYLKAARIPNSRYAWAHQELLLTNRVPSILDQQNLGKPDRFQRIAVLRSRAETKWTDYFLWHLTRPAEALVRTFRASLPKILATDEAIARRLLQIQPLFSNDTEALLQDSGLLAGFEPTLDATRKLLNDGKLNRTQILDRAALIGSALNTCDPAWVSLIQKGTAESEDLLLLLVQTAVNADPPTAQAWIETIYSNDDALKTSFARWMVKARKSRDPATVKNWLAAVAGALRQGRVVGNPEVAAFKSAFNEYAASADGWKLVRQHLEVETLVPAELRAMLSQHYRANPELFWRLHAMVTGLNNEAAATIIPRLQQYLARSRLDTYLLEQIAKNNFMAADSIDPVWTEILKTEAPITRAIRMKMIKGAVSSDFYQLCNLALNEAMRKEEVWRQARPYLLHHLHRPDAISDADLFNEYHQKNLTDLPSTVPVITRMLADPVIAEEWRRKLLGAIKYVDKSNIIADFLLNNASLQTHWARAVAECIARDPTLTRSILDALVRQRVGDLGVADALMQTRMGIAQIILEDRVLFEQLLAYKHMDMQKAVAGSARQHLTPEYAKPWNPSP